jgi:hypothetical protein
MPFLNRAGKMFSGAMPVLTMAGETFFPSWSVLAVAGETVFRAVWVLDGAEMAVQEGPDEAQQGKFCLGRRVKMAILAGLNVGGLRNELEPRRRGFWRAGC